MEFEQIFTAFIITLLAGLCTGIGGILAILTKKTNTKFLSIALGFSAGVMIYVSFVEIFPEANVSFNEELSINNSNLAVVLSFFAGIFVVAILDNLLPSFENPHEVHRVEEMNMKLRAIKFRRLYKVGILTSLAIAMHNLPEGFATFATVMRDIKLGIPIAIAIAIHNIPEGIAISIPIFYSTKSRTKALLYSFLSGATEPIGAILAFFFLSYLFNGIVFGVLFASVAGIMVFISLDQLLPAASEYGEHKYSIFGLVAGMAVMALSILFLN